MRNTHAPLAVQLGVVTENALLVERNAPRRGEVIADSGARGDARVVRGDPGTPALEARHRARKSVAQAADHLEERQVGVGHARAAIAPEHAAEVVEELRHAVRAKVLRAALRLALLVLVVQAAR